MLVKAQKSNKHNKEVPCNGISKDKSGNLEEKGIL